MSSVTKEQVSVELNLDTSVLGKAKREIAEFSRDGHLGFLHAGNGAREFHKTLHGLVEEVPVLGLALKAVLSPIGAALTAGTMLFTETQKHLEEWNKEMDKAGEEAAKPVGMVREELNKLAIERQKHLSDEKHWLKDLGQEHNAEIANLEERLRISDQIYESKKKALGPNASADDLTGLDNQRVLRNFHLYSAAQMAIGEQVPGTQRMATGAAKFAQGIKEQIATAEKQMKGELEYGGAREKRIAELDKSLSGGPGWNLTPGGIAYWRYKQDKMQAERDKLSIEEQASIDRYKSLSKNLKELNARLNESAYQADHWKRKSEEMIEQQKAVNKLSREYTQKSWDPTSPQMLVDGGIPYRPLQSRSIQYSPIPGAPGYRAPVSDVVALDPDKQRQAVIMDLLMQQLKGRGIPVIGVP
jgi:hypothetical protein